MVTGYRLYTRALDRRLLAWLVVGLALAGGGCLHEDEQRKILLTSDRDGDYALYAMNADGSHETRVFSFPTSRPLPPLVSPDGESVLLTHRGLWVLGLHGKRRTRVARGPVYGAAWAPDGGRVAYSGVSGLAVVGADGTAHRRLTRRAGDGPMSWSGDGRWIAYAAGDGLRAVESDSRRHVHLTRHFVGSSYAPAWAPAGDRLAFVGGDFDADLDDLYVVRPGAAPRRLARGATGTPAWSPDGKKLAYTDASNVPRGSLRLVIVDPDTGRRLHELPGVEETPIWSDDGTRLIYAGAGRGDGPAGLPQVWSIRADGTDRRRLTSPEATGGMNRPLGWIGGGHATEAPPRPVTESRPAGERVLRVPHAVGILSAEDQRVAVAPPPLEFESFGSIPPLIVWSPERAGVGRKLSAGCRSLGWPTLSAGRIVYDCDNSYVDSIHHTIRVLDVGADTWRAVFYGRSDPGLLHSGILVGGITGGEGVVAFGSLRMFQGETLSRRVWRLDSGGPRAIRSSSSAGVPVATDRGRIVVHLGPQRLAILQPNGALVRMIRLRDSVPVNPGYYGGERQGVALDGDDLIVATTAGLAVYRINTGRLAAIDRRVRNSHSLSAAGGLAAYVTQRDVRVRSLRDGREVAFRVRGSLGFGLFRGLSLNRLVHADLTTAGLFYSYNLRDEAEPGRVVFVPRAELMGRLTRAD